MKFKKGTLILLMGLSIAYLVYQYLTSDFRFGMMMYHHYGYYDSFPLEDYYVRILFQVIAYAVLIVSGILLYKLSHSKTKPFLTRLNQRLSSGEITIAEYNQIKQEIERG